MMNSVVSGWYHTKTELIANNIMQKSDSEIYFITPLKKKLKK